MLLIVAGGAIRAGGAIGELAPVGIFVAIPAALVRHRPPEVAPLVALRAGCFRMFPDQWKLGGVMPEVRTGSILGPAIGVVAAVAGATHPGFLERTAMRIGVAPLATAESQALVLDYIRTGSRPVAFLAGDRLMQAGKRERCTGMTESRRLLKGLLGVAARALGAELAAMWVLVAGGAFAAQAEERTVQIFQLDLGARGRIHPLRAVAVLALLPAMLAFQRESGLGEVVEGVAVQTHQREGLAIMFHMTTRTIRLTGRIPEYPGVKPGVLLHPAPDLRMAFQALEPARASSKVVT